MKLADFGLVIDMSEERPVSRLGTLDYMAPEVLLCPANNQPENKEQEWLWYNDKVSLIMHVANVPVHIPVLK